VGPRPRKGLRLKSQGEILAPGIEGTGAYGAEVARFLTAHGVIVIEVDRPDRKARRDNGKSKPIDACGAATAVLSGRAGGTPEARNAIVEAIRTLRVARKSAVKARTRTINQIRTLIVAAPSVVRDIRGLPTSALVDTLARSRPAGELDDPACAVRIALRRLARRYKQLDEEIKEADREIGPLVARAAPNLLALPGLGPETAGQLLTSAGDNSDRLRSEAAFSHLCGAAPVAASSGRTSRHRLNRDGDRATNNALHTRLGLEAVWPVIGKPCEPYGDNTAELKSEALRRGCDQHGIRLWYRPPGLPHFGGIADPDPVAVANVRRLSRVWSTLTAEQCARSVSYLVRTSWSCRSGGRRRASLTPPRARLRSRPRGRPRLAMRWATAGSRRRPWSCRGVRSWW
jgi:transposase